MDIFKVFDELEKEFFSGNRNFPSFPDSGSTNSYDDQQNDRFFNRGFPFGFIGDIPSENKQKNPI